MMTILGVPLNADTLQLVGIGIGALFLAPLLVDHIRAIVAENDKKDAE